MDSEIKVSVVMPVYNTKEEYLEEAIESILEQTLKEIELIIIDDNSNEATKQFIGNYLDDDRIRVVENLTNLGVAGSLNRGIEVATGKYIARMDSDDVSYHDRLEKQYDFMEANSECLASGTNIKMIDSDGNTIRVAETYSNKNQLKTAMFFGCSFFHPTMIMRNDLIKDLNFKYNQEYTTEDYELWNRMLYSNTMLNMDEILLKYRVHESNVSFTKKQKMDYSTAMVQMDRFNHYGYDLSLKHDLINGCEGIDELKDIENAIKYIIENLAWIDINVIRDRVICIYKNSPLKRLRFINKYIRYWYVFGKYDSLIEYLRFIIVGGLI